MQSSTCAAVGVGELHGGSAVSFRRKTKMLGELSPRPQASTSCFYTYMRPRPSLRGDQAWGLRVHKDNRSRLATEPDTPMEEGLEETRPV